VAAGDDENNRRLYVKKIKSVDVKSVFRISVVLGAVAATIFALIAMIMSFIDGRYMEGLFMLIVLPIVYSIVGALLNAFMAKIYNIVAERVGGIEIELE
jgi:hypothetical protein